MPDNQIDPVEFGRVLARLDVQDETLAKQDKVIAEMRDDIKSLLAAINKGKGAWIVLLGVSSVVGGAIEYLAHMFAGKH